MGLRGLWDRKVRGVNLVALAFLELRAKLAHQVLKGRGVKRDYLVSEVSRENKDSWVSRVLVVRLHQLQYRP